MIMTTNELLTKQAFITKLILCDDEKELSKNLKVKIMKIRTAYNKFRRNFDEDVQKYLNANISEDLKNLAQKEEKSEEDNKKLEEMNNELNSKYQEYLISKGNEEVKESFDDSFTEEEYSDIIDVNSKIDVEINGTKLTAPDFLEIFYSLFVAQ